MRHLFSRAQSSLLPNSIRASKKKGYRLAIALAASLSLTLAPSLLTASSIQAQSIEEEPVAEPEPEPAPAAPTVRFARGEDVDLAEIVAEWRGYYEDVPVYQCVCQEAVCDQTAQWPYREFDRFQLSLALGPTNGLIAESSGLNCFDIADGSRPGDPRAFSAAERSPDEAASETADQTADETADQTGEVAIAPPRPEAAPAPPTPATSVPPTSELARPASGVQVAASSIPQAIAINDGAAIQLTWPSGTINTIDVSGRNWNINVLDAVECESLSQVDQKTLSAQKVVGTPVVDGVTGNVAVPVLLDSCVDTDQSAVFVLDANEGGGYALYRAQLPGDRTLPDEFSTYAFSSLDGLSYWDGALLVRQNDASGAESLVIFRPSTNPAGEYAGCGIVNPGEGAGVLCP